MKSKLYFIYLGLIQIIISIFTIINRNKIFEDQKNTLDKTFESSPELLKKIAESNVGIISIVISSVICIIIAVMLILVARKDTLKEDRAKLINLTLISSLLVTNEYLAIFTMIGFVMALSIKKEQKEEKDKTLEEIPKLEKHNSSIKEIILGICYILLYFSQYLWGKFIPKEMAILVTVVFELILIFLALSIYINDLKRDFKVLKENKKVYLKYSFKKWGIMLITLFVIGTLLTLIFNNVDESVNQELLKSLPLLYVIPSAIIMAPIVEETIFRIILRKIVRNDYLFIVISALSFGLIHVTREASIIDAFKSSISYIAMGALLAHSYVKTNNSFISMMIHCIQNTFGSIFLIFS